MRTTDAHVTCFHLDFSHGKCQMRTTDAHVTCFQLDFSNREEEDRDVLRRRLDEEPIVKREAELQQHWRVEHAERKAQLKERLRQCKEELLEVITKREHMQHDLDAQVWFLSAASAQVMWVARVEHVESNRAVRVLRWATVEGLRSRGEVTFKENSTNGTTVELSILHSLPAALGRVMQSSALKDLVQATLQSDLECFQKYAAEAMNQQVDGEKNVILERKGSLTITTDCNHEPQM